MIGVFATNSIRICPLAVLIGLRNQWVTCLLLVLHFAVKRAHPADWQQCCHYRIVYSEFIAGSDNLLPRVIVPRTEPHERCFSVFLPFIHISRRVLHAYAIFTLTQYALGLLLHYLCKWVFFAEWNTIQSRSSPLNDRIASCMQDWPKRTKSRQCGEKQWNFIMNNHEWKCGRRCRCCSG